MMELNRKYAKYSNSDEKNGLNELDCIEIAFITQISSKIFILSLVYIL